MINDEMQAQRASMRSLERLRLFHALTVFVVTAGVLAWSVELWRLGRISTGDVVLTTTLGFTVLHASRDFAMALVDLVQQFAKLGEAVQVLGLPHEMKDAPDAQPLAIRGGAIAFKRVNFCYPNGRQVLTSFNLGVPAGQRVGLIGQSGAGKSTILALLQRLYDPNSGAVLPQIIVALASPAVGRIAEQRGRRLMLLIGFCALPLRGLLFATSSNPVLVVAVQALDGIGGACFGILVPLIVSDVAARSGHFNLSLGVAGFAIGIGGASSTPAAGWLADHFSTRIAFFGLTAVGLAATLIVLFAMPETRPTAAAGALPDPRSPLS